MLVAEMGTGQVFWSMLWFFLFFIWIMILFRVFADLFMSSDLSGFAKVLWCIFVIFLPYLGVFVYLIARGHKMTEHAMQSAAAQDAAAREPSAPLFAPPAPPPTRTPTPGVPTRPRAPRPTLRPPWRVG